MPGTTQTIGKAGALSVHGIAKETTFATAPASPSLYVDPLNPQAQADIKLVPRNGIRATAGQTQSGIGQVSVKGTLEFEATPDVIGLPLALAMGVDGYTAGTSGAINTHVLTLGGPLNTFTYYQDLGAGTVHQFVGCKAESLDLTIKPNSFLTAKLGLVGVKDVTNSATLASGATFSTVGPYLFEHITAATLGGVAIPLDSLTVSLKNNVKPRWFGGSGHYAGAIDETMRQVTGSFTAAYVSEAIYAIFASQAPTSLVVTFTSPATAGTGQNYSLTIALNNITLESAPFDPKRNDVTSMNVKFSAFETASKLQDDLKITVLDMGTVYVP